MRALLLTLVLVAMPVLADDIDFAALRADLVDGACALIRLERNEWRGEVRVQARLADLKPAS